MVKTIANTDVGAGALLPLTSTTSLSSQFSFRTQRNPSAPVTTDLRNLSYVIQLTQKIGLFTLTALHSDERAQDFVAPTDLDKSAWRSNLRFQSGPFSSQLRLGLITERDLIAHTILVSFLESSFTGQLRFSMATLALSLERLREQLNAKIKMSMAFGVLSTSLENALTYSTLTGTLSYTFTLSAGIQFSLPVPLTPTKGRIEGVIFADQNGNGLRDPDELNLENVILRIAGERVRTDSLGQFRSPPLEPGSIEIQLENLPPGYTISQDFASSISLKAGEIQYVQIPVVQTGFIRGSVFEDANTNGARDAGERPMKNISISLSGPVHITAQSDASGQFSVTLPPGHYLAMLEQESLPKHYKPVGKASAEIDVEVGKIAVLTFGVAEVTEIRYAPSADFTLTPETIHTKDAVTFDGSLSIDSDGQIVLYEWDFDGDGSVDETGEKVTHVFTSAGSYSVRLRVTDNDDNQNDVTKIVIVKGD
ncbi:PKD domain-containing protein [Candidatus Acetothermia bacterium]|nr:PKD domain-containing protein [Candidatus Acetothermia bacterium]MBI3642831.1 PKD domain-containing protein [Candidatus Acetothermia bacterium]